MRSDVNHKHAPNARPARCAPARFAWSAIVAFAVLAVGGLAAAEEAEPGCAAMDAKACVGLAMTAMGGRAKLAELSNAQLDIAQHTMLVEQSYRQEPFITSYDRMRLTLDFAGKRQRMELHSIWPEANPDTASAEFEPELGIGANTRTAGTRPRAAAAHCRGGAGPSLWAPRDPSLELFTPSSPSPGAGSPQRC